MSNFRRSHRNKNERTSFAVQSDPKDFEQLESQSNSKQYNIKTLTPQAFDKTSSNGPKNNDEKTTSIQDPEKEQKIASQNMKFKPFRARKNPASKVMKLHNDSINFERNVYSIAITDLNNGQNYISTLQDELQTLRDRIRALQCQSGGRNMKRTIGYDDEQTNELGNNFSEQRSRTIQGRRSLCGKFYFRGDTLNSERRSSRYSNRQQQSAWRPQQQEIQVTDFDAYSKDAFDTQEYQKDSGIKNALKSNNNYRVKQSNKRSQGDFNSKNNEQIGKFRPAGRSATLQKRQEVKVQVKKEVPQELKPVFVQKPQWQINSIQDDFRDKIMKKLQIPTGFPMKIPQITDKLQEYYRISSEIYSAFNVNIQKCKEKLVVRRFKNGVYFQLKPNKNIVWYFHGTFYFGQWETDLPSQGDKNGFGFEYVPKKYFYLGQFKDGMRHGKGTIKIINIDEPNPDLFTCYDGEWIKGKPCGYGKQIDQKNNKYMGNFENGEKTGSAIILNRDGLYYEGQVKNGLKHGYGVEKLVNGDNYIGQFVEGKFQGHGIYKWKNGSTYEGQFQRGKRQGRGKWKSYNGDQFDGDYVNDIKHGWGKFTWENGEVYQGEFRNDIRHGAGTYKHPSGKMGKFMWIEGQIDHRLYSKQQEEYRCRNMNKQAKQ